MYKVKSLDNNKPQIAQSNDQTSSDNDNYLFKYEGQVLHSLKEGQGKITWRADKKASSKLNIDDTEYYEGEWHKDQRHGYGKQKCFNGCTYEGYWKDDKMHGYGVYCRPFGKRYTYTGQFNEGKRHGFGRIDMHDGCIYEGEW